VPEDQPDNSTSAILYSRWSRYCVGSLFALSALWGGLQIAFPDSTGLYLLFAFMFALSATFWARYDSLSRGKPILPILQMLYFLLWPVGATIYLVTRSGWRGFATAFLYGGGMLILMGITFYATFYGLHFTGLLDARYYQPQ
jgi:hypothetical protein